MLNEGEETRNERQKRKDMELYASIHPITDQKLVTYRSGQHTRFGSPLGRLVKPNLLGRGTRSSDTHHIIGTWHQKGARVAPCVVFQKAIFPSSETR